MVGRSGRRQIAGGEDAGRAEKSFRRRCSSAAHNDARSEDRSSCDLGKQGDFATNAAAEATDAAGIQMWDDGKGSQPRLA